MATAIFTGVDTGAMHYSASYDASRPNVNSSEVVVYIYIRAYTQNEYFGYNLYLNYLNLNGSRVADMGWIKDNSPNTFDKTVTFGPYYIYTTSTSIPNCYISLTSTNNSGNSGKYNYGNFTISCPAYVEPNINSLSVSISNVTMTSWTVNWSTDRAAKNVYYEWQTNGGSWSSDIAGESGINKTSGSFTVSGKTHDTQYRIAIKAQAYASRKLDKLVI